MLSCNIYFWNVLTEQAEITSNTDIEILSQVCPLHGRYHQLQCNSSIQKPNRTSAFWGSLSLSIGLEVKVCYIHSLNVCYSVVSHLGESPIARLDGHFVLCSYLKLESFFLCNFTQPNLMFQGRAASQMTLCRTTEQP